MPKGWRQSVQFNSFAMMSSKNGSVRVLAMATGSEKSFPPNMSPVRLNGLGVNVDFKSKGWNKVRPTKVARMGFEGRFTSAQGFDVRWRNKREAYVVAVKVPQRGSIIFAGSWPKNSKQGLELFGEVLRGLVRCRGGPRHCAPVDEGDFR
jgi:hypothetical protein